MTQKELERFLRQNGWEQVVSCRGATSHINYKHPSNPNLITIQRRKPHHQVKKGILAQVNRKIKEVLNAIA